METSNKTFKELIEESYVRTDYQILKPVVYEGYAIVYQGRFWVGAIGPYSIPIYTGSHSEDQIAFFKSFSEAEKAARFILQAVNSKKKDKVGVYLLNAKHDVETVNYIDIEQVKIKVSVFGQSGFESSKTVKTITLSELNK